MQKIYDPKLFEKFGKKREKELIRTSMIAVIYTRVSTKEQAETNLSLETQMKYCLDYAKKNGFKVIATFGGTYESAKSDERKEFKKMLQFIKTSLEKVSHILVYSADRFSRSGASSISIAAELLKEGVRILPVTQPVDTATPEGQLHQAIQFIFSQYDNSNRKKKTVDGMIEMLRRGYTAGTVPFGYTHTTVDGEQRITVNEKGELLRLAFHWKAYQKMTTAEISDKLKDVGLNISQKHLSKVFHNPYYCGLLANKLLDGEVVKGKHEALISEETFLIANEVLQENHHAYTHKKKDDDLPLRRFLLCDKCDNGWVGYLVHKKGLRYYKCNQPGCKCNQSAKALHKDFEAMLVSIAFNESDREQIKQSIIETYGELVKDNENEMEAVHKNLNALQKKLSELRERHAEGKVEYDVYQEFKAKYEKEIAEIHAAYTKDGFEKSNLENFISYALDFCQNLHQSWVSGDYDGKQRLQRLVFPEGLHYNKQNDHYRTTKVNHAILEIWRQTRVSGNGNGEKASIKLDLSPLVAPDGIEPPSKVPETFVLSIKLRGQKRRSFYASPIGVVPAGIEPATL